MFTSKVEEGIQEVINHEFMRLNNQMVDLTTELMEEKDIPDTLGEFYKVLSSMWAAYYMSN